MNVLKKIDLSYYFRWFCYIGYVPSTASIMSSYSPGSTGTVAAPRMVFQPPQQVAVNLSTSASSGTSIAYQLPTNQMLTSGQTLAHQGIYGIRSTIGARQVGRLSIWDEFSKAYFDLASVLSSVFFHSFIFMASNIAISKYLHHNALFAWRAQILRLEYSLHFRFPWRHLECPWLHQFLAVASNWHHDP